MEQKRRGADSFAYGAIVLDASVMDGNVLETGGWNAAGGTGIYATEAPNGDVAITVNAFTNGAKAKNWLAAVDPYVKGGPGIVVEEIDGLPHAFGGKEEEA